MCDIIWPPAPFQSCYLARNLNEVARAWSTVFRDTFHARSLDSAALNSELCLLTVIGFESRIGGGSGLHEVE